MQYKGCQKLETILGKAKIKESLQRKLKNTPLMTILRGGSRGRSNN